MFNLGGLFGGMGEFLCQPWNLPEIKGNLGCRERSAKGPAGAVEDGKKKGKKGGKGGKGAAAEILDGTNIKANMYILFNKDKLSISNTL